jgi:membrane-associated phospholipid phosphatase
MSFGVKVKYLFLAFVPYSILYYLFQTGILLHEYDLLIRMDTQIPFVPEFVWIYHTLIPVTAATSFILFHDKKLFSLMTYGNLAAGAVLCIFYILIPSYYPREAYVDTNTISGLLVELTRGIDGANNTFPSGHVTFSWLLAYFVGLSKKGKQYLSLRIVYLCWAVLIATSTLTLKQHYLIDVVSGIALASIIFYISRKVFLFRSIPKLVITDADFISPRTSAKEVPVDC